MILVISQVVFDAVIAILISLVGDRVTRRRHRDIRRRIKAAAATRDRGELLRLYQSLEPYEDTPVRPDALLALADVDPFAAQPILREAIEDEAWVALMALDRIEEHRLVDLREDVHTAEHDARRFVASHAASVGKRLDKAIEAS